MTHLRPFQQTPVRRRVKILKMNYERAKLYYIYIPVRI